MYLSLEPASVRKRLGSASRRAVLNQSNEHGQRIWREETRSISLPSSHLGDCRFRPDADLQEKGVRCRTVVNEDEQRPELGSESTLG